MRRLASRLCHGVALSLLAGGLALQGFASPAFALDAPATLAAIDEGLAAHQAHLEAVYKDIHAHPELGFAETRTAALLAREMLTIGFEVTEHVGRTGLVAIYHNGPGPLVLVRTELDALPMEEKTGLPYASHVHTAWQGKDTPVGHMCGHDIHMAAWLGTAETLVALKARWHGTLMFVAQPAEELGQGAKAMLSDGLFSRFGKPNYGFALHVGPAPAGLVLFGGGIATSNADDFTLTFKGRGGHGSAPASTIDPIVEAGHFIVDVQSVVSREKDPAAFGVLTIGAVQAGTVGNIIPDEATLTGTIRSYDGRVRATLLDGLTRTANAAAQMSGAPSPTIVIGSGSVSAVVNDQALATRTGAAFKAAFGGQAITPPGPTSASEDFSDIILAGIPSQFFGLGALDPALFDGQHPVPSNHSPAFAPIPGVTIHRGVEAMSLAVMNVMS